MKITKFTAEETTRNRTSRIHWRAIPDMVELVENVKKLQPGSSLMFYIDEWPLRMRPAAFFQSKKQNKERGLTGMQFSVRNNEEAGTVTIIRRK